MLAQYAGRKLPDQVEDHEQRLRALEKSDVGQSGKISILWGATAALVSSGLAIVIAWFKSNPPGGGNP